MKYLILLAAISLPSCNRKPAETHPYSWENTDSHTRVKIHIAEVEGRKFAVASTSHGVSIVELKP